MNRDSPEHNHEWSVRFALPYPLLSDSDGVAARRLGVMRSLGIAGWTIELLRRSTLLVGADGVVAAVWKDVRIRGHAQEVLRAARGLMKTDRPSP